MDLGREFNATLRKKLKSLSKHSPIYFSFSFNKEVSKIFVKVSQTNSKYHFDVDMAQPVENAVRKVYLTLFDKEYPRLESLDGNVYVIDKVNLIRNLVLLKKLSNPDSEEVYACKLKIPVVLFLRDYCSTQIDMTPMDRWNIYVSLIDSIYRGDDIYK